MPFSTKPRTAGTRPAWLTEQGIDLARLPIESVLRQALSADKELFRAGCSLLGSMSHSGRIEAGVFLIGLLKHYSEDYERLTMIAEALASYQGSRVGGPRYAALALLRRTAVSVERAPRAKIRSPWNS